MGGVTDFVTICTFSIYTYDVLHYSSDQTLGDVLIELPIVVCVGYVALLMADTVSLSQRSRRTGRVDGVSG